MHLRQLVHKYKSRYIILECMTYIIEYCIIIVLKFRLDIQSPVCEDLNECSMNISRCLRESEECVNLAGSYTCECRPGYVYSHIRVGCVLLSDLLPTVTQPPAPVQPPFIINSGGIAKSGHATTVGSDQTGLLVLLIIPFVVFLLLIILAAFVCYCWFKMYV